MKNYELLDDYIVEDLGIQEEWVYDIEVENDHNFFANDILVHNSTYISMNDIVKNFNTTDKEKIITHLAKFTDDYINPEIKKGFNKLADIMNAHESAIKMARENIADRAIWTAKKHYVMNVWNKKGKKLDEPELKIVGLEVIKNTIPIACKKKLKEALKIIMSSNNNHLISFIDEFKMEFRNLPIDEISSPRKVSDVTKYEDNLTIYGKKTPMHTRAAILYNYYLRKNNLENKYALIRDDENIKFCYLRMPNPIQENIIGLKDGILPEEFGLTKYIDYDTQFEKTFLDPLDIICKVINWKTEEIATLEGLFG